MTEVSTPKKSEMLESELPKVQEKKGKGKKGGAAPKQETPASPENLVTEAVKAKLEKMVMQSEEAKSSVTDNASGLASSSGLTRS